MSVILQSARRTFAAGVVALLLVAAATPAAAQVTRVPIAGAIDRIKVNDLNDPWSGGEMVVGGSRVIIPRNLLIDLPANRLTLTDLFLDGPPECANLTTRQSGLASADSCLGGRPGGYATVLANRIECGDLIAGEVRIDKSLDALAGVVTFISYTDGYFRVNGAAGSNSGGTLVRINDPTGRHTIQRGLACGLGPNCSPDPRFALDSDNYTVSFATGYPMCIPSTLTGGLRTTGSSGTGTGDPFCPATNRGGATVADSTRFAPLQAGDHIVAAGNYEVVNGVRFYSVHSLDVASALVTRDEPGQPDYIKFDEVSWDAPGFNNLRARLLLVGRSTLPDSQIDIFALRIDPRDNSNHEQILASTVNNPAFINAGVAPTGTNIWKIQFDTDFLVGPKAARSVCITLSAAVPSPIPANWANFVDNCQDTGGTFGEFLMLSPLSREIIGHTRRRAPVTAQARDVQGQFAPSSRYLTPIGSPAFPEFIEINLAKLATPYTFAGVPWNLDRRLSPGGCSEAGCETTPQPLDPFPFEGLDMHPGQQVATPDETRSLTYFTFENGSLLPHLLDWPPAAPACTAPGGGSGGGTGGGGGTTILAVNDRLITPAGAPLTFTAASLLGNDTGTGLAVIAVDAVTSAGGTVAPGGASAFIYTPRAGFFGDDTFTYTIRDGSGNTAIGTVLVTVTDAVLPTVSFASPAAGSTVSGTVTITANAADNIGVASVQFFVNGVPLGIADQVTPYQAAWNTTGLANGTYVIGAQAQDLAGNQSNVVTMNLVINTPPPTPPAGLVLELTFDEATGTSAADSSGGNRNGTIVQALHVPGKVGNALSFDGVNDIVTVPDQAALDLTTGMTLEAWVNPSSPLLAGWRSVILKERTGGLAYAMYAQDGGTFGLPGPAGYASIGGVDRSLTGPSALPANTWTHIATTYDGVNQRFFVNGVQVAVRAQTGSIVNGNGPLQIGGNNVFSTPTTEFFKGLIDEVRVYNRALSAAEITADMNKVR